MQEQNADEYKSIKSSVTPHNHTSYKCYEIESLDRCK